MLSALDLHIETNDNGFVLGKNVLGSSALSNEANQWREVRSDFSAMTLERAVSLDKGVLFRPEAPVLSLRTVVEDYYEGFFGRLIRIRWKNDILFTGNIKNVTIASQALVDGKDKTTVVLSGVGVIDYMNNYRLYNFEAPQESVAARIARIKPFGTNIVVTGGTDRLMAEHTASSPSLLEQLQDAADVAQARFYVNKDDVLIIDDSEVPEPIILFSDDPLDTNRTLFNGINVVDNLSNTITGVVVTAKRDQAEEKLFGIKQHPSALVTNELVYEVDVPVNTGALEAWAESFPLKGEVDPEPTNISCYWQDELADLDLTHQVDIKWQERGYRAGIRGISYELNAETNNKLRWNVKYDLFPAHLLGFNRFISPNAPTNFFIDGGFNSATSTVYTDRVTLTWKPPVGAEEITHYEVRMTRHGLSTEPEKAPQNRFDGELITVINSDVDLTATNGRFSYLLTGLEPERNYWFTLWGVTDNEEVRSAPVIKHYYTPLGRPSAPRNFSATWWPLKDGSNNGAYRLVWDDPTFVAGRMGDYDIWFSETNPTPGSDPVNDYNGTAGNPPSRNKSFWPSFGVNETNTYGFGLNQQWYFGIRASNADGTYGPFAYARGSSLETVPSAVNNLVAVANNYKTVTLTWNAPTTVGNLAWYDVRVGFGGVPGRNDGFALVRLPSATRTAVFDASQVRFEDGSTPDGGERWGFGVWPVTTGLRSGPRSGALVTTPQGIIHRYWEGEATWTQSYRQNGQQSSLGRGFSDDLYYGYGDTFNQVQRSMIGFNLPANLTNNVYVEKAELIIYNKHTWYGTGAEIRVGYHNATNKPATFQSSTVQVEDGSFVDSMFISRVFHTRKPGWLTADITHNARYSLKLGAKGLTINPRKLENNKQYYGYAAGIRGPKPKLRIWYRTLG